MDRPTRPRAARPATALATLLALAATWPWLTGRRRAGARTPGRLAVLVTTAAFLVMLGLFGTLVTDPMVLASQPRALLNALAVRGLIALVATAWTSLRTGKAWIHREGTARRRAVATLASGSAWTLIGVAAYWNVLGFAW